MKKKIVDILSSDNSSYLGLRSLIEETQQEFFAYLIDKQHKGSELNSLDGYIYLLFFHSSEDKSQEKIIESMSKVFYDNNSRMSTTPSLITELYTMFPEGGIIEFSSDYDSKIDSIIEKFPIYTTSYTSKEFVIDGTIYKGDLDYIQSIIFDFINKIDDMIVFKDEDVTVNMRRVGSNNQTQKRRRVGSNNQMQKRRRVGNNKNSTRHVVIEKIEKFPVTEDFKKWITKTFINNMMILLIEAQPIKEIKEITEIKDTIKKYFNECLEATNIAAFYMYKSTIILLFFSSLLEPEYGKGQEDLPYTYGYSKVNQIKLFLEITITRSLKYCKNDIKNTFLREMAGLQNGGGNNIKKRSIKKKGNGKSTTMKDGINNTSLRRKCRLKSKKKSKKN